VETTLHQRCGSQCVQTCGRAVTLSRLTNRQGPLGRSCQQTMRSMVQGRFEWLQGAHERCSEQLYDLPVSSPCALKLCTFDAFVGSPDE